MNRRAASTRLKRLLAKHGPRPLSWYHTVGGLALKCLPAGHRYGVYGAFLDRLVDSFASQASARSSKITTLRGILDTSQAFHRAYTVTEVRELESPREGTHRLTWNHLRVLVRLPAAERQRMQRDAMKGKWSSGRLMREIQLKRGRKNRGGRRIRKSPGTRQALQALIRESERWLQRVEADWGDAAESPRLDAGDASALVAEVRSVLAELKRQVGRVARAVEAAAEPVAG